MDRRLGASTWPRPGPQNPAEDVPDQERIRVHLFLMAQGCVEDSSAARRNGPGERHRLADETAGVLAALRVVQFRGIGKQEGVKIRAEGVVEVTLVLPFERGGRSWSKGAWHPEP